MLALTAVGALAIPAVASAQSNLPATVSASPVSAAPGDAVTIAGRDFPRDTTVVLELATTAGPVVLTTVATTADGSFRQLVTIPEDAPAGAWPLQARAADGTSATFAFRPPGAAADPGSGASGRAAAGNSTSDNLVLLVLGVGLGILGIAGLYAWRLGKGEVPQPGMGSGDDLIWGGRPDEEEPEMTASDEPFWKAAQEAEEEQQPDPEATEARASLTREAATSA
jgi:hypothetical protein